MNQLRTFTATTSSSVASVCHRLCWSASPHCRMLYTELLQLWDAAVQAVDAKDWSGTLDKLEQISEPTSRTLFNTASAHLALGQLAPALQVCG